MDDDYYESAKGITISHDRAIIELRRHGAEGELDEFYMACGYLKEYKATTVLRWLGY